MAYDSLYWSSGLILNMEGTNGSTTFTDISQSPKTPVTIAGNAQISTAQAKSGTAALLLDGTGDYLAYTDHADFNFGSEDFCVELWFRPAAGTGTQYCLVQMGLPTLTGPNTEMAFNLFHQTTGKIAASAYIGSGAPVQTIGNDIAVTATWRHIAMVREGALLKIFTGGVLDSTVAISGSLNAPGGTCTLRIGQYATGSPINANGYIDGVRITKGFARYTGTFTPDAGLYEATEPGTASAALTPPSGLISVLSGANATLSATMGALSAIAAGRALLSAPMGTLRAVGHSSEGERDFSGAAPMGSLTALSGATAMVAAPMGTLIASVTVPVNVLAELVSPMGTLLASSTVGVSVTADLRLTSAGSIEAYSGGRAVLTGPMGTLQAIATAGVLARFAESAPMGTLSALATAGIVVRAELTAPMLERSPSARAQLIAPMGMLTAYGGAVITVTYEAYATNLKPGDRMPHQVTKYTAFPFDQIIRYQGGHYGVAADGLYLLGGDTDDGDAIAWEFDTGITDFGSSQMKVVRETFVGARLGTTVSASVSVGEAADKTYAAQIVRGASAQNHRVKYGRGLEARYWSFGFADTAGSEVNIDTLEFDARETSRKI